MWKSWKLEQVICYKSWRGWSTTCNLTKRHAMRMIHEREICLIACDDTLNILLFFSNPSPLAFCCYLRCKVAFVFGFWEIWFFFHSDCCLRYKKFLYSFVFVFVVDLAGANRTGFEIEQTKNWPSPTNCSTLAEVLNSLYIFHFAFFFLSP